MKRRTKIIIGAACALFSVAACVAVGAVAMKARRARADKPIEVRLAHPERGDLIEFVNAPGQVEPLTKVSISAKVSARVVELPFEEGDSVKKGDVVVRLDSTDLEADLDSAEASRNASAAQIEVECLRIAAERARLQGAKASVEKAETDLDRLEALAKSHDTSQSEVDAARSGCEELRAAFSASEKSLAAAEKNIEVLQYRLEGANAGIARAKDRVSYAVITSPIDGVITRTNTKVGELVMIGTLNNPSSLILEVADLSQMLLVVEVDESDVGGIRKGQRAVARIHAYRDEEFEGVVESIALTHDLKAGGVKYFKTKIRLDTGEKHIYSGLTADVDIETTRHENVIKVPSQTVLARAIDDLPLEIREDNPNVDMDKTYATVVYRLIDGKAVVTPVTTGESDATHTIIESGLEESDLVVVGPYKVLDGIAHDRKIVDEREAKKDKEEEKGAELAPESSGESRGAEEPAEESDAGNANEEKGNAETEDEAAPAQSN